MLEKLNIFLCFEHESVNKINFLQVFKKKFILFIKFFSSFVFISSLINLLLQIYVLFLVLICKFLMKKFIHILNNFEKLIGKTHSGLFILLIISSFEFITSKNGLFPKFNNS